MKKTERKISIKKFSRYIFDIFNAYQFRDNTLYMAIGPQKVFRPPNKFMILPMRLTEFQREMEPLQRIGSFIPTYLHLCRALKT